MPAPAGSAARGLTAAELASALVELRALEGAAVVDAVALIGTGEHDDLLLVLQPESSPPLPSLPPLLLQGGCRCYCRYRFSYFH